MVDRAAVLGDQRRLVGGRLVGHGHGVVLAQHRRHHRRRGHDRGHGHVAVERPGVVELEQPGIELAPDPGGGHPGHVEGALDGPAGVDREQGGRQRPQGLEGHHGVLAATDRHERSAVQRGQRGRVQRRGDRRREVEPALEVDPVHVGELGQAVGQQRRQQLAPGRVEGPRRDAHVRWQQCLDVGDPCREVEQLQGCGHVRPLGDGLDVLPLEREALGQPPHAVEVVVQRDGVPGHLDVGPGHVVAGVHADGGERASAGVGGGARRGGRHRWRTVAVTTPVAAGVARRPGSHWPSGYRPHPTRRGVLVRSAAWWCGAMAAAVVLASACTTAGSPDLARRQRARVAGPGP